MLDRKIREERKRRNLSQDELARSAGVPRSQLAILENGGNVTLSTLRKIISRLEGIRLELVPETLDVDQSLRDAAELQDLALTVYAAAGRLVTALGGTPREARPATAPAVQPGVTSKAPEQTAAATARHDEATVQDSSIDPQLLQKLELLVDDILRQRKEQQPLSSAEPPDA